MATGTVKWFNPTKGYGFIQPQGGGKDVFVHISAVEKAGLSTLNEGQQGQDKEVAKKGKPSAQNLKVKVAARGGPAGANVLLATDRAVRAIAGVKHLPPPA